MILTNTSNINYGIFTSKEIDPDTGLYYFNARWYDPTLGRFITEDPIKDGTNWHVYCNNNPINYIDPTGLTDKYGNPDSQETITSSIPPETPPATGEENKPEVGVPFVAPEGVPYANPDEADDPPPKKKKKKKSSGSNTKSAAQIENEAIEKLIRLVNKNIVLPTQDELFDAMIVEYYDSVVREEITSNKSESWKSGFYYDWNDHGYYAFIGFNQKLTPHWNNSSLIYEYKPYHIMSFVDSDSGKRIYWEDESYYEPVSATVTIEVFSKINHGL